MEDLEKIKQRIWERMELKLQDRGYSPYMSAARNLKKFASLESSRLAKFQIKERLFANISEMTSERVALHSSDKVGITYFGKFKNFFIQKKILATAMCAVFIFIPIFEFIPMVSAGANTTIEVSQGLVSILRDGENILVEDQFVLNQGDKVTASQDSLAHIYFIDDSRITLGPGSEVVLTEIYVDSDNRAKTEVVIDQLSGEIWTQVLNLVSKDSFFAHRFPDGEISVSQRASFNVKVDEGVEIKVARNLINVMLSHGDKIHQGTLGQGVKMLVAEEVLVEELSSEEESDIWWTFNLAFEKSYARTVEEKYKEDAIKRVLILPGNPLYKLKTFQEDVQSLISFTKSAKMEFANRQVENRLREAQALSAQGEAEMAEQTLVLYEEAVNTALELNAENAIVTSVDEVQKELMTSVETDIMNSVLDSTVNLSLENAAFSVSQKLQKVPDLIEVGDFETAQMYLESYRDESKALLTQLENLAMDERGAIVESLLEQKIHDLQMLRIIAAMPAFVETIDVNAQILQDINLMVLSLRERELNHLTEFFNTDSYEEDAQMLIYSKLKNNPDLDSLIVGQLEEIEENLNQGSASGLVVEMIEIAAPVDHRLNSLADETQD